MFGGFALATALAVPLGLVMGTVRPVERNLDPLVESFRPIAAIAILPLVILWIGTGNLAAVVIVAYAAFFPDPRQHRRRGEADRPELPARGADDGGARR